MKNKLIILTCIIFFIGIFFVFDIEGFEDLNNSISIKNVNIINNKEFENIKNNRSESEYDLLDIKYRNNEVPYDSNKNIYYISKYNNGYDFDVFYSNNTNVKSIKVNDKNFIEVIAYNKNKYKVYNICLSEFPIVNINLNNKKNSGSELISKNYTYGNVNIFDNKQYKNKLNVISESAKFKTRGLSSMSYKKKSYSIQFIYSNSGENKLVNNLLGLKKNNRYALNSLYEDNSKIRDILSLNLWKNIDKDNANDVDMKYVELFINNEYYGLYGLSDIINEYTLNDNNGDSIIYKINDHVIPSLDSFNDNELVNNGLEIVYPKKAYDGIWNPLKNLIQLVYYSDDKKFNDDILNYIDIDNCVDYFILCELTHNADGLWRNNVFKYNKNDNKLIKVAWDFDLTWGSRWDGTNELMVNYDIKLSNELLHKRKSKVSPTYLEKRLWDNNVGNFRQKVAKRWKELRIGFLETESFVNYANSLYDEVTESGAREREHKRWPDGGYSTDNSFIEKFIRQRLPYLDSQFLQYLDDSGEN